jgi:NADPH:quinone reductase
MTWKDDVKKLTSGKGVNVAVDLVGMTEGTYIRIQWKITLIAFLAELSRLVSSKGRIIIAGFAGGKMPKIPMNLVLLKNISLVGVYCSQRNRLFSL